MDRKHIVWNVENINRLQDFIASKPEKEIEYFGYQVGEAVADFCSYFVADIHKCDVLDYGCELGHIMYWFCKNDINIWGWICQKKLSTQRQIDVQGTIVLEE